MSPGLLLRPAEPQSDPSLAQRLSDAPQDFLAPSHELHAAALAIAKKYLDPLADSTSRFQEQRLEATRRKRKRGKHDDGEGERAALKLREVYLDGFTVDGIWGQARRVLEASSGELDSYLREGEVDASARTNAPTKTVHFAEDGFEIGSEGDMDSEDFEDAEDDDDSGDDEEDGMNIDGASGTSDTAHDDMSLDGGDSEDLEDLEDIEADSEVEGSSTSDAQSGTTKAFVKDKHGLNDGFFDIDEFNRDSEFLEQADERGDDDGAASDEDEIDWDADPVASTLQTTSRSKPDEDRKNAKSSKQIPGNGDEDEDDEENGPTFGSADLNAPWSDDEDEDKDGGEDVDLELEDTGLDNTNEIRYEDFFEPPPRALTKSKRMRALPKTQPADEPKKPTGEDVQRAIDSHRRDLFDDDFSDPDASPDDEIDEDAPGMRNLSTHERKQVALAKQIRELEAASVAKRSWQLSGEATAHVRPENALLEEDLEFERTGKPVPVITADVTTSIEDMIKERIINRQFDEVIKRLPGTDVGSALGGGKPRRGLLELSDQKDPQSLAESYEQAYLAQNDPNAKDPRSEALKTQHAEIEKLWAEVSGKLDALTSWRYKPKPPGVEVKVITDAPKVLMEDARPSGVEGISEDQGGLAPQEVFRVGQDKEAGEEGVVTTKAGGVLAKEELSKEQKLRRRRREKERTRKKVSHEAAKSEAPKAKTDAVPVKKSKKDEETEVLKTLKAGGVKVIGKGGKLEDVEGQKAKKASDAPKLFK